MTLEDSAGDIQAFGFEDLGNRSVVCCPGTAVLATCSSKSSADARLVLAILGRSLGSFVDLT